MSKTRSIAARISLAITIIFMSLLAFGQTNGRPDISPSEARRISPFPPRNVIVKDEQGSAVIWWQPGPPSGIAEYRIYKVEGDKKVLLGSVQGPPFRDASGLEPGITYAVTLVDRNNNESALAKAKCEHP